MFSYVGFKEFARYFDAISSLAVESVIETERIKGVEMMKLATRQYARKQIRWIRNKLLCSGALSHELCLTGEVLVEDSHYNYCYYFDFYDYVSSNFY